MNTFQVYKLKLKSYQYYCKDDHMCGQYNKHALLYLHNSKVAFFYGLLELKEIFERSRKRFHETRVLVIAGG